MEKERVNNVNENEENEINKLKTMIYACIIIISIMTHLYILARFINEFSLYIFLLLIPIILFVLSIIGRKNKEKRISNIICILSIIFICVNPLICIIVNKISTSRPTRPIDAQEVSIFNAKFDSYIGDKVNASSVRSLIYLVMSNNVSSPNQVTLFGITSLQEVQQTKTYTTTVEYGEDGLIKSITITPID